MAGKNEHSDSRLNVARYRVDRLADGEGEAAAEADRADRAENAGQPSIEQHAQFVEIQIQQAMRRGDFDDLPGAGRPLKNLDRVHDPDWWIRQKIEDERITGLAPPALTLRTESEGLEARIDGMYSEPAVRELLDQFNTRVVEARRQLKGGPPVVTPTRDVEAEIDGWRRRRIARQRSAAEAEQRERAALEAMTWRERRRSRRGR